MKVILISPSVFFLLHKRIINLTVSTLSFIYHPATGKDIMTEQKEHGTEIQKIWVLMLALSL